MQYKYIAYLVIFLIHSCLFASENAPLEIKCKMAIVPESVNQAKNVCFKDIIKLKKELNAEDYVVEVCIYNVLTNCPKCYQRFEFPRYFPTHWVLQFGDLEGKTFELEVYHACSDLVIKIKYSITLNQRDHPRYACNGKFEEVLKKDLDAIWVDNVFN